jgi:hypothetical protein
MTIAVNIYLSAYKSSVRGNLRSLMQSHGTVLQLTEWDIKTRLAKFPRLRDGSWPLSTGSYGAASTDRFVNITLQRRRLSCLVASSTRARRRRGRQQGGLTWVCSTFTSTTRRINPGIWYGGRQPSQGCACAHWAISSPLQTRPSTAFRAGVNTLEGESSGR